jgi:hypothetical protein
VALGELRQSADGEERRTGAADGEDQEPTAIIATVKKL